MPQYDPWFLKTYARFHAPHNQSALEARFAPLRQLTENHHPQHNHTPIISIGGTNGKGSTAFLLAKLLEAAGLKVGLFLSPHLLHAAERIQINGVPISSESLKQHGESTFSALQSVLKDRHSWFEWLTLTAMSHFLFEKVEVIILEVGLGGRLDSTNLYPHDLAILTAIDLDHTEMLGQTREAIALEKVQIARAQKPLVLGEGLSQFEALTKAALALGASLHPSDPINIPAHTLLPSNSARCASLAFDLLALAPLSFESKMRVLKESTLQGRYQWIEKPSLPFPICLDVAHNPAATQLLANHLQRDERTKDRLPLQFVFGCLQTKDYETMLESLLGLSACFHLVGDTADGRMRETKSIATFLEKRGLRTHSHENPHAPLPIPLRPQKGRFPSHRYGGFCHRVSCVKVAT